jgi:hypothetical protein
MRPALLAVPLGLVLFFAGLWIGHRISDAGDARLPEPPTSIVSVASHDQEMARSIVALGDEIRRLREEIGAQSSAAETRVPADGSLSELTRRTQTLETLVERMTSARTSSGSAISPPLSLRDLKASPGYPTRADLFRDVDGLVGQRPPEESADDQAWNAWMTSFQEAMNRWTQAQLNWSIEEVIERYGQPDSVNNDGQGPTLIIKGQEADGSPADFHFSTKNGLVVQVRANGKGI